LTALANRVSHPKNVYLREADVLGRVDDWLAELFGPARIDTTLSQLTEQAAQLQDLAALDRAEAARTRIAEYDPEISQYRASFKAGGDPAVIGPWIAETQAKKVAAQADIRTATGQSQMSRDEIAAIVTALGDLAHVVSTAEPADKSEIYAQLGLALTYQPGERLVEATIRPGQTMRKGFVSEDRVATYVHEADRADRGVPSRGRGCRTATCPAGSEPSGLLAKCKGLD